MSLLLGKKITSVKEFSIYNVFSEEDEEKPEKKEKKIGFTLISPTQTVRTSIVGYKRKN